MRTVISQLGTMDIIMSKCVPIEERLPHVQYSIVV